MPAQKAIAEFGWRGEISLADWLLAEGYRFDFTQAVRLLEIIAAGERGPEQEIASVPLGRGPDPERELVRLRAAVGFAFPPREVAHARRSNGPDSPAFELTTNFFALAGARAPLPDWVGELLVEQERSRDTGLRDFLDIFHHRLLSLLYRVRLHHRPWLDPAMLQPLPPGKSAGSLRATNSMAGYLLSFAGLGTAQLQGRLELGDEELLPYAGLLWHQPRSALGLKQILEHALQVPVRVREHIGVWRSIEPEDRTRVGARARGRSLARNNRLGSTTVLGTRVWDAQGRFDLLLGPLRLHQFESLLPSGALFRRARALVRFYTGEFATVHLQLTLAATEVPSLRLGRARLGQTSWVRPKSGVRARYARVPLLA